MWQVVAVAVMVVVGGGTGSGSGRVAVGAIDSQGQCGSNGVKMAVAVAVLSEISCGR
jgi:hypothetical protein